MDLNELTNQAMAIQKKYDQLNKEQGATTWRASDYMAGLVGDIGDLSKLIMAYNGLRSIEDTNGKIAHELADCLWSLLVLADFLDVNLLDAFEKTMAELHGRLDAKLVG